MSLRPLFASMLFSLTGLYINSVVQVYTEKRALPFRNPDIPEGLKVLPDLGFDLLPVLREAWLADVWVGAVLLLVVVRFLVRAERRRLFRRWLTCLGCVFLLRAVSIIVTVLPNPLSSCVTTATGNPFKEGILIVFQVHRTCSDVFFSGHASNLTLAALVFHSSSHKAGHSLVDLDPYGWAFCSGKPLTTPDQSDVLRCSAAKIGVWSLAIVGYFLIIATRFHYTLDVLLGVALSCLVFQLYHHYQQTASRRDNTFNRLIVWLESDDEGRVEGQEGAKGAARPLVNDMKV